MIELEQRSAEWHKFRAYRIGSSESPIIMNGYHFERTPLDLYKEKVNHQEIIEHSPNWKELLEKSSQGSTFSYVMNRGIELEPLALSLFERETGYLMMPTVIPHPTIDWMAASLDGLSLDSKVALEIKSPGLIDHNIALQGKIPEKYMPQLQHIMEVAQLESMFYMSYRDDNDYKILEVKKDYEYTKLLIEKELEFWDRVQRRDPPPPSDKDITEIKDPYWSFYVDKWRILQDEKRKLEEREIEIRDAFIQLADNHPAQGFGLKLTKVKRVGNLDYQKIVNDYVKDDVDLEIYRKPSTESWRINMKDESEE